MAVDTTNMSDMDLVFWTQMNAIGASMEAYKRTSPRAWYPDKLVYKITRQDESEAIGEVVWGLETYPTLLKIAKGEI